jgi:hypothetical protein
MEPGTSAELMLRVYDLFLLCLALVLAGFAALSLLAYFTFLCTECLSPPHPSTHRLSHSSWYKNSGRSFPLSFRQRVSRGLKAHTES